MKFQRACATSARGHVQEVSSSSLTSWQWSKRHAVLHTALATSKALRLVNMVNFFLKASQHGLKRDGTRTLPASSIFHSCKCETMKCVMTNMSCANVKPWKRAPPIWQTGYLHHRSILHVLCFLITSFWHSSPAFVSAAAKVNLQIIFWWMIPAGTCLGDTCPAHRLVLSNAMTRHFIINATVSISLVLARPRTNLCPSTSLRRMHSVDCVHQRRRRSFWLL